jgi:hypothetical protein
MLTMANDNGDARDPSLLLGAMNGETCRCWMLRPDGQRFVREVPICGEFEPNMLAMLSTRSQPGTDAEGLHYTVPTCMTCGHGPTCGDHKGYLAILPADLDEDAS